jgi:hypothetical protein
VNESDSSGTPPKLQPWTWNVEPVADEVRQLGDVRPRRRWWRELPYIVIGIVVVGVIVTCGVTQIFGGSAGTGHGVGCYTAGPGPGIPTDDPRVPDDLRNRVQPVACDEPHAFEAYRKGRFTGADAELRSAEAASGSIQAWATCDRAARDFLGGDYAEARVALDMLVPTERNWRAGNHSFTCVMAETAGSEDRTVQRVGSLRDGLRGDRPLRIGCVDVEATTDKVNGVDYIGCDYLHAGEFVGSHSVPDATTYPDEGDLDAIARDSCALLAASYLSLDRDQVLARKDLALLWDVPLAGQWSAGDHSIRCYVVDRAYRSVLRGSIKGIGPNPAPS